MLDRDLDISAKGYGGSADVSELRRDLAAHLNWYESSPTRSISVFSNCRCAFAWAKVRMKRERLSCWIAEVYPIRRLEPFDRPSTTEVWYLSQKGVRALLTTRANT